MSKHAKTPRLPERMQRQHQRAHKFVDRKKAGNKKAARGKVRDW